MTFGAGPYRCEVSEVDGVFIGRVFEEGEQLATLTADSLDALRRQFNEWVAG